MKTIRSALPLALGLLFLPAIQILAEEPRLQALPTSGDDLRTALNLNLHKEEVDFGSPKLFSLRISAMGNQTDAPVPLPASSKATIVTYYPPNEHLLHYWLTTSEGLVHSGTIYFAEGQASFMEQGLIDGVYTIKGSNSKEGLREHPAWMVQLQATDPSSTR